MTTTPTKDAYRDRIQHLDRSVKITDLTELQIGDYVCIIPSEKSSGVTGFVTSVGRVNVKISSQYGGWGGADSTEMELKVRKSDISMFYKPKK